jgi:hypothetical protein
MFLAAVKALLSPSFVLSDSGENKEESGGGDNWQ